MVTQIELMYGPGNDNRVAALLFDGEESIAYTVTILAQHIGLPLAVHHWEKHGMAG